ncbi:MAG: AI-2E family transporter [Bacilli bacterium]
MSKKSTFQYLGFAIVVIIINQMISNYSSFNGMISTIYNVFRPIIIGVIAAYFIYPIVLFVNKKLISKVVKKANLSHQLSTLTCYVVIIIIIYSGYIYIKPILIDTFISITKINYDSLYHNLQKEWSLLQDNYAFLANVEPINYLESFISNMVSFATKNGYLSGLVNITSSLYAWIMGAIISIYVILSKDEMLQASNKFFQVIFSKKQFQVLKRYFIYFEETFRQFFFGKLLDSLIIGIIALVGLYFIKVPFYFVLAIIVGITNVIPYFGPFIGAIPVILVTLFVTQNPIHALWSAIFMLALQQFDGIYLGPKILGDSVGVSSVWVIIAIIIGGALAGVTGLLICIPVAATIKKAVNEYYAYKQSKDLV